MKRLFLGIPLSEEIKAKIKSLGQKLRETEGDFNFVPENNLHFTVKFLGEVEENKILEIQERTTSSLSLSKKLVITVEGVGVFPSQKRIKVIWVGAKSPEMVAMMKTVSQRLNHFRKNEHEETIHLTVARVRSGKNKIRLLEFLKGMKNQSFGEMVVEKVILYESERRPEGPIYKAVKEFVLR